MRSSFGVLLIVLFSQIIAVPGTSRMAVAQNIKLTVGQTGINPGTSLFFIAQKEHFYAKHGLDLNIVGTNTTAAVQAMLG